VQAHLFEPFLSSKEEGRGLGLAIVAKIASDLGAVVELDREFNDGTRFILSFMCS
jgi:two-component system nitrogen regulation sensor histidine kinase GlnL